jgi:hypothetical protein
MGRSGGEQERMKTIDLDFSEEDANKIELLPAGFADLARRAQAGNHATALGGFGWPVGEPVVWFVVCGDAGNMDEAVHLAVCADEQTARDVTERIGRAFSGAGAARVERVQ